jgi:hypothetical protein
MNDQGKYTLSKLSKLVLFIVLVFISKSGFATDSLGIALKEVLFFESGNVIPEVKDRIYIDFFKPESRFINIELTVNNLLFSKENRDYKLTFIWKYLNGDEFGRMEADFNVKSEWTESYISRGWGFADKGNWRLGRFTAQILVDGVLFAEKDFCITSFDVDFLVFSEESKSIAPLLVLPKDISYKILHQYKIEPQPFFNYFYDIKFSPEGKDIIYALSHFEYYSGSTGSSTTRDMYLFRNNKQILPSYYMIHYGFDKNFKNLSYFGLKLTTSNIYEAIGLGYYNGLQIYKSQYALMTKSSPDGEKYCFVMNSMPAIKSSFTWDAAYEYLMINNNKVLNESLKIAKSINITCSSADNVLNRDYEILFVKNQDGSYSAVYSAKYKLIDDVYYALFHEDKIISPIFDGYISRPYLSSDEKSVAYIAEDKKEFFIMLNDKRITKGYKQIKHSEGLSNIKNELVICESGTEVVYQAKIDGDWYVMKGDEKISDGFSDIESIVVSSAGDKIAYKAKNGKSWSIYVNKSKISQDNETLGEEICFSPDYTKVAYIAANKNDMWVMVNDKQISSNFKKVTRDNGLMGNQPLAITSLSFNNTGEKLAYIRIEEYSGSEMFDKIPQGYVMINDKPVSPKMFNPALFSKKAGEIYYAGTSMSDFIMNHVQINF